MQASGHKVTLGYHGTRSVNLPSICKHGLVVPGTLPHVKVANGSAYGIGIYLSEKATVS
jgi:hypothetical protein